MGRNQLVKYYEDRLEKIKKAYNPQNFYGERNKKECEETIKFAEKELEEVKNGRNW